MDAFQPFTDRPSVLSYFELPERVLASDSLLRSWLEKALDVARRAAKKKPMRKRTGAHAALGKLDNLGPKSSAWLAEVGVKTRADLERLGSVRAFELVRAAGRKPSMNLLWTREATLLGARWDRLSDEVKRELRARAGLAPPKCKG